MHSKTEAYMEKSGTDTGRVTGNQATGQEKWTFMVYMAGDSNLDGAALRDIAEMARAGHNALVDPQDDNLHIFQRAFSPEPVFGRHIYLEEHMERHFDQGS
jgi:hypothetical protein